MNLSESDLGWRWLMKARNLHLQRHQTSVWEQVNNHSERRPTLSPPTKEMVWIHAYTKILNILSIQMRPVCTYRDLIPLACILPTPITDFFHVWAGEKCSPLDSWKGLWKEEIFALSIAFYKLCLFWILVYNCLILSHHHFTFNVNKPTQFVHHSMTSCPDPF